MNKDTDKTKEQLLTELVELRKGSKEQTDKLKATNQQLQAGNQQLQATEQQLRAANQQLEASIKELIGKEHLLSSIFNTVGDVLFLIDAEDESKFRFKYINKAFIDATGLSRSDIEGKLIEEVIPESSISLVKDNYLKSIKEKKLIKWKETTEYPAGVKIGIVSIVPVIDEKRNCRQLVGSVHDITERIQAEEAIKESEEKFQKIIYESLEGISIANEEGKIIVWNTALEKITGIKKVQTIDRYIWDVQVDLLDRETTGTNRKEEIRSSLLNILKTGKAPWLNMAMERDYILPDGTVKRISGSMYTIKTQKGFLVVSVSNDITEHKHAEQELSKLSTAVTQSPSIIAITDTDGNLEYVNPKFSEITGYNQEELIGHNPRILQAGEHSSEMYKELWETILSGKIWHGEFHNKKKNGELYWESASISPLFDEKGKIINYVKDSEDISESKQTEKELRKYRDHLEELVNERTSELEKTLKEVEQMNELFVGREFRIKELREQVKDLKQKLNYQ